MKLVFTYRALDDLNRLRAFIAQDNAQAARRMSQALRRSIGHLVDQPQIGTLFDARRGVRQWVAGHYVVHYLHDDEQVTVLRIWHGREHHPES